MDNDRSKLELWLEAKDDASANISRVEKAFESLRTKAEQVTEQLQQNAFNISSEAMEATIKRMETSMAGMYDRIGAHAEGMAIRIINAEERASAGRQRAFEQELHAQQQLEEYTLASERRIAQAAQTAAEQRITAARNAERQLETFDARLAQYAEREAQQESAARQRVFTEQRAQMASHVEAFLSGERLIAESAEKAAQARIISDRKAESELEGFDARLSAFVERGAERRAAAADREAQREIEAQSRADAERMRSIERRQAAEQQAASRGGGIEDVLGGAIGGIPGVAKTVLGAAGGAAGGIFGFLGGAAQGGLNLLMAPIRGIGEAFVGITSSIAGAGKEMLNLIATGVGLYGTYQIAMQVQQAFMSLKDGVLEFQDVMVRVSSLTGATTGEMRDMSAAVLQVSMQTGRSAVELGEAMYFIESHGVKGADALNLLSNAGKLSAAGLGQTNQIVRVVAGQLLAYGEVLDNTARSQDVATHYFDVFARTVQISAVPAEEVANTFARITPLAAALHIGIDELGADFATISQTGLNASRVMTDLIAVFNNFLKGGKQQEEALKGIGLSVDMVRKTLGDKGLIAAAEQIWQAADRDINAVSQVFGDRTRALVGYLALVEDGGKRADENLRKMQQSAGTTASVFEAALTRVSVQWQRFTNIIQAFAIVAGSDLLGPIATDMNKINDALQKADFSAAADAIVEAFQHVGQTVMSVLDSLGKSMFGAGMTMMETLANGIIQGINTALNAAVNAVADFIAGFLLGHSWPPRGPLAGGNVGVQRWQQEYASAMLSNGTIMAGAAANVAGQVNAELGKIGGGPGSKAGLEMAIANIDQQLLPWKLATEDIKNNYEAQLHPLERQIAAIQRIKDLEYERQQLGFEQRDLELRMMRIRAEGDPMRRAQLAGQLAAAQERREQHSIESRIATLNRESANLRPGRGTSAQEISLRRREIGDELNILRLQQAQHHLVNVNLLGQYETKKAQLDVDKEGAKIAHDAFDLQQKQTLQPLLQQRDKLKAQEQAELDIIDQQTQGLQNQRNILEAHLRLVNAITGANKAAAGGGAGPWRMPETGGLGDDLGVGISKGMQRNIEGLANEFSGRLSKGVSDYFAANGPKIGAGFVGTIVGGMVGGIPGAIAGAFFGVRLLDALEQRGVSGSDLQRFADRFMGSLKDTFSRVQTRLNAHDFLGAVEEVMVTARAWIAEFQTSFFREWATTAITPIAHSEGMNDKTTQYIQSALGSPGSTRFTGLGRTIIEAMFGQQDRELNFQIAYDLVNENVVKPAWEAIQKAWADFTAPTDLPFGSTAYGRGKGPSQAEQIGRAILGGIDAAVKWVGTNVGPVTGKLSDTLGKLLGDSIVFVGKDEQFKKTAGDVFENLGGELAMRFIGGFTGNLGTALWNAIKPGGTRIATGEERARMQAERTAAEATGAQTPFQRDNAGAGDWGLVEKGKDAIQGFWNWMTGQGTQQMQDAGTTTADGYVRGVSDRLGISSPSTVMYEMGQDATAGFANAIADDNTTGAIVRMWLRSEVIMQARSILLVGEGRGGGGLPGIAEDALTAFADVFGTTPPGLANNLDALGRSVVTNIMEPISDPRTGLIARMQRTVDAMGRIRPTAGDTLPTPEAGQRYAATGQDFVVGGSGGTDSQYIPLWATPGERVTVGAGGRGGGQTITNHFNITVNGGDPDEVRAAIASGIQEGMGEHHESTPNQMLNAWRTAKAQGANKPYGTQSRGARG